jgi:5-methylcytosine-specific restriction endonuclease McrA
MDFKSSKPRKPGDTKLSKEEMDQIIAKARQANAERMKGYREQSLRIHPWVCARCGRQFTLKNLHLLTVHHKDHNHENNPPDGSNWENLCVYCHDNEHGRYLNEDGTNGIVEEQTETMTHNPFANLGDMLKEKKKDK